ncbi:hypothetical protein [Rheinheimera maricola]|uniref:Uncharacterized protein n=1 Tax=Rheinheimera maricola TaxID=2793282 RepID=A0ABS7XC07_9GAMM|nr:hypothetical protein [Rheinheimera maricola]MBZ9613089.1 hypothetical protein [Rheinheimera maricola]
MKTYSLLLSLVTFECLAQNAYFCHECNNVTTAQTQALQYAPELRCDSEPILLPELGEEITACSSDIKRVILVNPTDKTKVYAFNVGHNPTSPYRTFVEPDTLGSAEKSQFSEISQLYQHVSQAISQSQQISVTSTQSQGISMAFASSCPQDTALDVLTDPQKMENLKIRARIAIGTRLGDGQNIDLSRVRWDGLGMHYGGVSVHWSITTNQLVYAKSFEVSEVSSSVTDVLVFKLEYLGVDSSNNLPLLNFELNHSSIAAGMTLSGLQGQFGALTITDECILERLEQLNTQGEFRDGMGNPVDFNNSNSGGTAADDSPDLCIYDFYNSRGERQYTFRAPCP